MKERLPPEGSSVEAFPPLPEGRLGRRDLQAPFAPKNCASLGLYPLLSEPANGCRQRPTNLPQTHTGRSSRYRKTGSGISSLGKRAPPRFRGFDQVMGQGPSCSESLATVDIIGRTLFADWVRHRRQRPRFSEGNPLAGFGPERPPFTGGAASGIDIRRNARTSERQLGPKAVGFSGRPDRDPWPPPKEHPRLYWVSGGVHGIGRYFIVDN